jgi:hypothetical protein
LVPWGIDRIGSIVRETNDLPKRLPELIKTVDLRFRLGDENEIRLTTVGGQVEPSSEKARQELVANNPFLTCAYSH